MTLKASLVLVAFASAFAQRSCPPSPQPPAPDASDAAPPPMPADGGAATDYNLACAALALAGCKEGQDPNCASAMQHNQEGRINDYKPKCLLACHDKACVHACGPAVECP